jgi:WD40 repeat protein
MEMNVTGTLLATYGFRTTKVWDTSSGKCKLSVQNVESRPRPLAMRFTNNSTMLHIGSDDRRLRSLDLNNNSPTWQLVAKLEEPENEDQILNAPNQMALNKNGSLIAVAHRLHPLSAWETDGPEHIGYCWRKREEMTKDDIIEVVWHPHDPEVLGLYYDGVVFKWRPYTDESAEISTGATKLAMSRDGDLFATGDAYGTVKVYTVSDFSLLYRLASQDSIFGLAFSPDSRRLYDVRGYYGNAWEPTALTKYADQTSKESDSDTFSLGRSSTISMSVSQNVDPITVISASPIGRLYCYGTEKGTVRLHDTQRGNLGDIYTSKSFLSVEKMSWSDDGQLLCFSDSSKKVFIMSMTGSGTDLDSGVEEKAQIPMKSSTNGSILQLQFHPDSSRLLVRTVSTICIISLASFSVANSADMDTTGCHWITHPRDPALIVGVGSSVLHILDWDLNKLQTSRFEKRPQGNLPDTLESTPAEDVVDRVVVTQDKKHLLVQTSPRAQKTRKSLLYFDTSSFATVDTVMQTDNSHAAEPVLIKPTILSTDMAAQIVAPLSFLSDDRLIFLSRTFSIFSWQLSPSTLAGSFSSPPSLMLMPSGPVASTKGPTGHRKPPTNNDGKMASDRSIKELFSLPGDWISREAQTLCGIWSKERSLLYPRNGELAVVRSITLA